MPDDMVEAHLHGVRHALDAGWRVLTAGGSAVDAVEEAVVVMEDDETFDAGRGSFLNRDGRVQLDSLIMDGRSGYCVASKSSVMIESANCRPSERLCLEERGVLRHCADGRFLNLLICHRARRFTMAPTRATAIIGTRIASE